MYLLKHCFPVLFLLPISLSNLIGQNLLHNTSIVSGVALGSQDRRSFSRTGKLTRAEMENNKLDYDLMGYAEKTILKYRCFELAVGVGYAESNTLFPRQINQDALNSFTEDIKRIKIYTINKLVLPLSSRFYLKENGKFYLHLNALPAIGFRKSVLYNQRTNGRLAKWQLALNGLEINPGLGIHLSSRLQVSIQYRWFYVHEVDEVLLISGRDITFPLGEVDKHNPFKMWLTVGYKLEE